jgi:hypothetical protein
VPGGRELRVDEASKRRYVDLVARHRMTGSIKAQIKVGGRCVLGGRLCVCVRVCACTRVPARVRVTERDREEGREGACLCVNVIRDWVRRSLFVHGTAEEGANRVGKRVGGCGKKG